jgi:hypothetical protein
MAPKPIDQSNFEPVTQGVGLSTLRPQPPQVPINFRWYATDTGGESQVQIVSGQRAWVTLNPPEWITLFTGSGQLAASAAAGTWVLQVTGAVPIVSSTALTAASAVFPLDPTTNYAVGGRTIQVRVVGHVITLGTSSTITYTFGLYPISSVSAGVATLGAASTTVAIASPGSNTMTAAYSSVITMPATGTYLLGCLTSGTNIATAIQLRAALQIRAN